MDKKQKKEQLDDAIDYATKKAEIEELQKEMAEVKVDHEELNNQLKRAIADYQNLEKRISEGRSELSKWATAELIAKILPVLSHFDKALTGASEDEKKSGWFRGVELAMQQLRSTLKDEGLEEISADGQFDPALHEAVDVKEMPPSLDSFGEPKDNMILEVAEKGYTLNGKVVKPAKVVVGKKGEIK